MRLDDRDVESGLAKSPGTDLSGRACSDHYGVEFGPRHSVRLLAHNHFDVVAADNDSRS